MLSTVASLGLESLDPHSPYGVTGAVPLVDAHPRRQTTARQQHYYLEATLEEREQVRRATALQLDEGCPRVVWGTPPHPRQRPPRAKADGASWRVPTQSTEDLLGHPLHTPSLVGAVLVFGADLNLHALVLDVFDALARQAGWPTIVLRPDGDFQVYVRGPHFSLLQYCSEQMVPLLQALNEGIDRAALQVCRSAARRAPL